VRRLAAGGAFIVLTFRHGFGFGPVSRLNHWPPSSAPSAARANRSTPDGSRAALVQRRPQESGLPRAGLARQRSRSRPRPTAARPSPGGASSRTHQSPSMPRKSQCRTHCPRGTDAPDIEKGLGTKGQGRPDSPAPPRRPLPGQGRNKSLPMSSEQRHERKVLTECFLICYCWHK